jgi:hypothetical protein
MKRTLTLIGLAVAVVLLLGGCMTQFGSSNGKLAYADIDGSAQGQVSIEKGFLYIIHPDLVTLGDGKTWETIDKDLEPELNTMGANAVRDLELGYGASLVDMILSAVVPVVSWGTYTIEGEAVLQ